MMEKGLTSGQILRVVNDYIGVSDGYLGDFSYRTHEEFYPIYCNLEIDTSKYEGTTRERFIQILKESNPEVQAKILRGVLNKYPPESFDSNIKEGRVAFKKEIESWISDIDERSDDLGTKFWTAFVAQINQFINEDLFSEKFSDEMTYCGSCGASSHAINEYIKLKTGLSIWPLDEDNPQKTEIFEKLVEILFVVVSKPVSRLPCGDSSCPGVPEVFDSGKGRYDYTVGLNSLFRSFNLDYRLEKGKLKRKSDTVLSKRTSKIPFHIDDNYLEQLIERSLDKFYKGDFPNKVEGLKDIVDAFERVKSYWDKDMKKSTSKLIGDVSPIKAGRKFLDIHLKELTHLGNNTNIRHHKKDVELIEDEHLVEYLYYEHYNIVKLMILRSLNKK